MKTYSFLFIGLTLMLIACNNNSTDADVMNNDSSQLIEAAENKMKDAAEDMEKIKDELSKIQPLTMDALKALIPEKLLGATRTNYEANNSMGAGLAISDYQLTDSTKISLSIYDCAGSAGAGIYSLQYLGMINMQQETDDEYTRTVDFDGAKAFEHCDKTSNDCTFTYFAGGRFLVTLEGDNVNAEALKQAARALNIK